MALLHGGVNRVGPGLMDVEKAQDLSVHELVPLSQQLLPTSLACAFGIFNLAEEAPAPRSGLRPGPFAGEVDAAQGAGPQQQAVGPAMAFAAAADQVPSTSYVSRGREPDQQLQQQQQQNAQLQNLLAASYQLLQNQAMQAALQTSQPSLPPGPGPGPPGIAAPFGGNGMPGIMNSFYLQQQKQQQKQHQLQQKQQSQQPQQDLSFLGFDPSGHGQHPPGAFLGMPPGAVAFGQPGLMPGQLPAAGGLPLHGQPPQPQQQQLLQQEDSDEEQTRALKRPRLVWTEKLHRKFEEVVLRLGVDKAMPKTIMQTMNVEGLTRENVASHLQKYRLRLKKEQEAAAAATAAAAGGLSSNSGAGSQ